MAIWLRLKDLKSLGTKCMGKKFLGTKCEIDNKFGDDWRGYPKN